MCKNTKLNKSTKELNKIILQNIPCDGILCPDKTLKEYIMEQREKILEQHKRSIWQNRSNHKWCTKLGEKKRLIVRKERGDLENAIIEFYLKQPTVDDIFKDWVQHASSVGYLEQKTINEYTIDYNHFIEGTDFANQPIREIKERDIIKFMTSLVERADKIPQKRYKMVKTIIRKIFRHALIEMEIDCISVKQIMDELVFPGTAFKQTNADNRTQVFKHSETRQIKEALQDSDNPLELGILLALETGVRVGELCVLTLDCITEHYLLIRNSEHKAKFEDGYHYTLGNPKKDKARDIVLNDDAKKVLEKILSLHDSDWLFPNKEYPAEWTHAYQFDRRIRRVCRNLNIPVRSMHKLRKTYASYLLSQKDLGVTDKMVQMQLGHSDISTTHRSYYYDVFDTDEKLRILSNIRIG